MQQRCNSLNKLLHTYFATFVLVILAAAFLFRVNILENPSRYIFDEDFFAFTAQLHKNNDSRLFEWWHGPLIQESNQYAYRPPAIEWLHPPLSKSLQALSLYFLGNTPIGWRLPSALFGVGIVWLGIELTQILFKKHQLSLFVGILLSFEHLLFTQSRIASPDVFLTFFILLTLWLYWQFHQARTIQRLVPVGISLGLAVACKWSALFVLPGLLIFEWLYLSQGKPKRTFIRPTLSVLGTASLLALFASLVYVISYWQLFYQGHTFAYFIKLHHQIFQYQTTTTFERPYSSKPWQWLVGEKPIWYLYEQTSSAPPTEIIAQPSRWLLLTSEVALLITLWLVLKRKTNKTDNQARWPRILLLLTIASLYLSWFFIERPLFIYHMTPVLPLLMIVLGDQATRLAGQIKKPSF